MPIVSLGQNNPFVDGRQSARALEVRKGVERHLTDLGWSTLPELTLKTGRRADLVALSPKGDVTIIEVKSSLADLNADTKWRDYLEHCDQLYFATLRDVPAEAFPNDAGLFIADSYGAEEIRSAIPERMSAPRRKELHLRFARASANRLALCCAHAGVLAEDFAED